VPEVPAADRPEPGAASGAAAPSTGRPTRLAILKALGDNTRYAVYLELARSAVPLTTADIAETLELHPNTVRPHLERMRDVGLLAIETDARGGVGRPQHRYSLSADAPSLGLEPPSFPLLARMLLRLAAATGAGAEEAADAGRDQGRADAADWLGADCLDAVAGELLELGFDPAVVVEDDQATVAFTHCPFRELAETHPDVVCSLHRGMVEGLVSEVGGGRVTAFNSLVHRTPCQVELLIDPMPPIDPVVPVPVAGR
jgi:predicted ArsR family transcriptional regulator